MAQHHEPMKEVDLYVAFGWSCPGCGVQNYSESVVLELIDEDRADAVAEFGEESVEEGLVTAPKTVKCKSCHERFKVTNHESDNVE